MEIVDGLLTFLAGLRKRLHICQLNLDVSRVNCLCRGQGLVLDWERNVVGIDRVRADCRQIIENFCSVLLGLFFDFDVPECRGLQKAVVVSELGDRECASKLPPPPKQQCIMHGSQRKSLTWTMQSTFQSLSYIFQTA